MNNYVPQKKKKSHKSKILTGVFTKNLRKGFTLNKHVDLENHTGFVVCKVDVNPVQTQLRVLQSHIIYFSLSLSLYPLSSRIFFSN